MLRWGRVHSLRPYSALPSRDNSVPTALATSQQPMLTSPLPEKVLLNSRSAFPAQLLRLDNLSEMSDNDYQANEQDIPVLEKQYTTDFHFVNR
jgi:hypothetical protein